ncbi:TPA: aminotransferase class I/II-fold pyridoxal phosphate-dependent enzyme, partial [Mannheimia haemolytica]|nr:aminotransferase class I/II-fold pyridoxal phosphate-dependent enzyme [Mannheimia haemolytica]
LLNRVRQPFNCNSLALASAIAVMNDDEFVKKVAENNRLEMARYEAFCQANGLEYIPSKGNFITIDFKRPAAPIYEALLREGVIVRSIAGYGMPNHLRISIGLPQENERFFTALLKVLA